MSPIVRVDGSDVEIEAEPGETIIEAAWRVGYHWPTVCWGQAQCTTCFVRVTEGSDNLGAIPSDEQHALDHWIPRSVMQGAGEVRLACRAEVHGDVTVEKRGVRPK
jgi:2Fe-2S ferredoxin